MVSKRPQEKFREVSIGPGESPGEAPWGGHGRVQGGRERERESK